MERQISGEELRVQEINPYISGQLIYQQEGQEIKFLFNKIELGHLDIYMQKNEAGLLPHIIYKTNPKWIRLKCKS